MERNLSQHLPAKGDIRSLLATNSSGTNEVLSGILRNLEKGKHSKLTTGMFFGFIKTAYQVKDSFEGLSSTFNANGEVDWNVLARINLNSEMYTDNACLERDPIFKDKEQLYNERGLLETNQERKFGNVNGGTLNINNKNADVKKVNADESDAQQSSSGNYNEVPINQLEDETKNDKEETKNILTALMKKNLSDVLHEGLLDSVLPYMIPKTLSHPIIKKSIGNTDIKKSSSTSSNIENKVAGNPMQKDKDKDKNKLLKKTMDNEVEIRVCDEDKNIKKNFRCPQKLLVQKMCYFADVTAGQKLEEIDISVHCDVVIFDWLMRWVKKDITPKSEWPILEASNVIPIMVSASFLQMEPLLESCLQYCHNNMSDILKTSTILSCLDDSLLTRLADRFTNEEVEMLKDKKDKIQSKLFCKFIVSLAEATADNKKGHYSSLSTLFKCCKCGKRIIQSISNSVPCVPSAMRIDSAGTIHSKHVRDLTWKLNDYIITLRGELRSWRKVYWRLWGDCHFQFCQECHIYFPIHQMDWCCYHPEHPQFFINEQQKPMPFPLGRYPCCSQRAYKFETLPNRDGCRYKEHLPDMRTQKDVNVINIFTVNRDVITMEPPQLFFPEKITRLVTREPSLDPGKLMCKETMWWTGIELVPQRPRFGLLGKIWCGSGLRRLNQMQRLGSKIRPQVSVTTDVSSPTSSSLDDDDDEGTGYEESSFGEDSRYSGESDDCETSTSVRNFKRELKGHVIQRNNGRCWSNNLNVRRNQDNQRDFEEKAGIQMMTLLTKRVSADSSLLSKSLNKQRWKKSQPIGGTYTKLEAEFREQFNQFHKCKSSVGKSSVRAKLNK